MPNSVVEKMERCGPENNIIIYGFGTGWMDKLRIVVDDLLSIRQIFSCRDPFLTLLINILSVTRTKA